MYQATFQQFSKQLGQLEGWLATAATYAADKKFEPSSFLGFRLAPDQFPLARQVQIACDTAKLGAARITGHEAPSHADTEASLDELVARVQAVRGFLAGLPADAFAGAATRAVSQPRWEGKTMTGDDYFREHVVPNFYFHLTHVYAILRHNGVPLGKRDYLGALTMHAPAAS